MNLQKALQLAQKAHRHQKDKGGIDYFFHPITVALMCKDPQAQIVALLHDVLEDSDITVQDLKHAGFSDSILDALSCLTRCDESYEEYIQKIKSDPLAKMVKLADLTHNMDISRIEQVKTSDLKRLEKYQQAYQMLIEDELGLESMIHFYGTVDLNATDDFYLNHCQATLYKDQGACHIYQLTDSSFIGFCTHLPVVTEHKSPIVTFVVKDVTKVHRKFQSYDSNLIDVTINPTFNIEHFFVKDPNGYTCEFQRFLDML